MNFSGFSIASLPRIVFGEGRISELPAIIAEYGKKVLLVTGGQSFRATSHWRMLQEKLHEREIAFEDAVVSDEPSPALVDGIVARLHGQGIQVVVGIGGGSVVDAAKAIAGLLPRGNSVLDHLEDVGRGLPYAGPALPFIAVPTTAGTGSEATKNAVLSQRGPEGYKKSFRHDMLVAKVALVDPALMAGCPRSLIAAQGMDAFTQLLESYLSLRANPFTDALAWSGLQAVKEGFFAAVEGGESEAARKGRAAMGYAALISGVTLAQAGLGSVHGLAQPLGSLFPIPHGVACGMTVGAATEMNISALRARDPGSEALRRYADVGRLLAGEVLHDVDACDALVKIIHEWTRRLELPPLKAYGITDSDIPRITAGSRNNSMKSNPILLSDEEIASIMRSCLSQ